VRADFQTAKIIGIMKISNCKESVVKRNLKAIFGISLAGALVLILMLAPAACSSSTPPNQVNMSSLSFSPSSMTVTVGTKVTWKNTDNVQHSVTSDTGLFDSGLFAPGGTYSYTFNTAGTYNYHCTIHSGMTGKIIVQ
jgi:plastocyanin